MLSSRQMAALAVKKLDDKLAKDIKILDVKDITVLSEYFVICTAQSTSQVKSLGDELERCMKEAGEEILRIEGLRSGGWILVDMGCLIVHIFLDEQRKFYNLEHLWADANEIDAQVLIKEAEEISVNNTDEKGF